MRQQDFLAANGQSHHYKLDQVLQILQERMGNGRIVPQDGAPDTVAALRDNVGKMPAPPAMHDLAQQTFAVLLAHRQSLTARDYSNLYGLIEQTLAETNGPSVRTFLPPQSNTRS